MQSRPQGSSACSREEVGTEPPVLNWEILISLSKYKGDQGMDEVTTNVGVNFLKVDPFY